MAKSPGAVSFNISGEKELYDALKNLGSRMGRKTLERAGMAAAAPTVEVIRSITPVDKRGGPDAGELRASIAAGISAEEARAGDRVYAQTLREGGTREQAVRNLRDYRRSVKGQRGDYYATVFIGPRAGRSKDDVIKGYVQEFGGKGGKIPPQSYLRAGFEQDKAALMGRLVEEIREEVAAATAKRAARAARRAAKAAGG